MKFTNSAENPGPIYSICDSVLRKTELSEKSVSFSNVRNLLIRERNILLNIADSLKREPHSSLSDGFLWFCDNFNHVDEQLCSCIAELKSKKGNHRSYNLPFEFVLTKKICEISDGALNEIYFDALVLCCDKNFENGLSYTDMCTFPLLIRCAVLSYLCNNVVCAYEQSSAKKDLTFDSRTISCIKTLKALEIYEFDTTFSECRLEKILFNDPSGAYPLMTDKSKNDLKHRLNMSARHHAISDTVYAERLIRKASEKNDYPGNLIDLQINLKKFYFPVLVTLSWIFSVIFCSMSSYRFLPFVAIPCIDASKVIADLIFSRISKTPGTVPGLKLEKIPDNAKTLCVITALLRGEKYDSEIFLRLERIYNANSEKNIRFGILCDLPDCTNATCADDRNILAYATARISSLNAKYNNNFILFIRPRSYSSGEKCFIPYERKRGAVCELIKFLKCSPNSFDLTSPGMQENAEFLKSTKYVITLDADTNLGLSKAKELVGKMLHPSNRPIIDKKGKVTSGYGIMQPKISCSLEGAHATPFTRLVCGNGGSDTYSSASFDIYQSLFSEGIFCGKGILDTDAFFSLIVNSGYFPENTVLSHDIIEGEILRCAYVGDIELYDSFPKNELSYLKRKHRWIRGDIQNLIFIRKRIKLSAGYTRNGLSLLSKYKISDNIRRDITPIFSLLCIITAFVSGKNILSLTMCAFLPYIVPFITSIFLVAKKHIFKTATRKFFSRGITTGLWQNLLRMLLFVAMLGKDATICISAVSVSLWRLFVTKTRLLEWVTAAASEKGHSVYAFISSHIISSCFGAFLFIFAPAGVLKASGLMFFTMPLIAYITSRDSKNHSSVPEHDKNMIKTYANDIWSFFSYRVNAAENHLPPDNVQISPYEKTAHRTSPTNIGLYLVSLSSARDFGFIDSAEFYSRAKNTLETIEKLKKWNGHLYNWYDTQTLEVLDRNYVSSVDSGNFVACLIVLKNALSDYAYEMPENLELISLISRLIEQTDLSAVYNHSRNLFYVGIKDGIPEPGCYDFLMSEARILSYIAVASRKVPDIHWKKLSRPLITCDGYIGISSWSGTAFEYFMPALFMPAEKGSFLYETLGFAFKAQRSKRVGNVWGISESGFFSFDRDLNYQYKAFGIPELMRKSDPGTELVISPYSTFLSMCVSVSLALENLSELYNLGVYGKHGFYEALDFTSGKVKNGFSCVKSYMSHHLGMSLAACANAALDGVVIQRFMNESRMDCARELLQEKIPVNAVIKKTAHTRKVIMTNKKNTPCEVFSSQGYNLSSPLCASISDGKLSCMVSDCGHVRLSKSAHMLCGFSPLKYPAENPMSLFCYVRINGQICGLSPISQKAQMSSSYSFSYTESNITSTVVNKQGTFRVSYTIFRDQASAIRIKLSGKATAKSIDFRFVFSPTLASESQYDAHPAFSDLFIESEYDEIEKILYYKRRRRSNAEQELILAVALSDTVVCPVIFTSEKSFDKNAGFSVSPETIIRQAFSQKGEITKTCINPICVIGADNCENIPTELIISLGSNKEKIRNTISDARKESFTVSEKNFRECAQGFTLASGISSVANADLLQEMLCDIIFSDRKISYDDIPEKQKDTRCIEYWKHGISGDYPIITIDTGEFFLFSALEKHLRAFRYLAMKNIKFDLVILYTEKNRYESSLSKKILKLVSGCDCQNYLGTRHGGIYIVEKSDSSVVSSLVLKSASYKELYCEKGIEHRENNLLSPIIPVTKGKAVSCIQTDFDVAGGGFSHNSFVVDKSQNTIPVLSHILSGKNISCTITQNSLGTTFYKNASLSKITPPQHKSGKEAVGEKIYIEENGILYDLAACSSYVRYCFGKVEFIGCVSSIEYKITVFCCERLPVKVISFEYKGALKEGSKLLYYTSPVMGGSNDEIVFSENEDCVLFRNPFSEALFSHTGFLSVITKSKNEFVRQKSKIFTKQKSDTSNDCAAISVDVSGSQSFPIFFTLGIYKTPEMLSLIKKELSENLLSQQEKSSFFCESMIPCIYITPATTDDISCAMKKMVNHFLPYSNMFSRFLARSGYHQYGGAYGYRDQLQDCLAFVFSQNTRNIALTHIYRAASRQFFEGDALHWWHDNTKRGIRSTCSDDYLWLVYACTEYFESSGNVEFMKKQVPYVTGDTLKNGENEKYIPFSRSDIKESLFSHCTRALDRACSLIGCHGLSLMGSCDWCDGYSAVGTGGRGESVWTSMFLSLIIQKFIPICEFFGEKKKAEKYEKARKNLIFALESIAFDKENGYFLRGFYDDGTPLGSGSCNEGKIDLLTQVFAPLCGIKKEMCISALQKAIKHLFDQKHGLISLVSPPYSENEKNPGYIMGYPEGIRENGGQYTHSAMFAVNGLFECASKIAETHPDISKQFKECAEKILIYSNPAWRTSSSAPEHIRSSYKAEPYTMAADIYTNTENCSRAGWTQYTGSSGWYYRMFLKHVLGFSFRGLDAEPYILISPPTPVVLSRFTEGLCLHIREFGFDIDINYKKSVTPVKKAVTITPGQNNITVYF